MKKSILLIAIIFLAIFGSNNSNAQEPELIWKKNYVQIRKVLSNDNMQQILLIRDNSSQKVPDKCHLVNKSNGEIVWGYKPIYTGKTKLNLIGDKFFVAKDKILYQYSMVDGELKDSIDFELLSPGINYILFDVKPNTNIGVIGGVRDGFQEVQNWYEIDLTNLKIIKEQTTNEYIGSDFEYSEDGTKLYSYMVQQPSGDLMVRDLNLESKKIKTITRIVLNQELIYNKTLSENGNFILLTTNESGLIAFDLVGNRKHGVYEYYNYYTIFINQFRVILSKGVFSDLFIYDIKNNEFIYQNKTINKTFIYLNKANFNGLAVNGDSTYYFNLDKITSIPKEKMNPENYIYPNPANNEVIVNYNSIDINSAKLIIQDFNGKSVFESNLKNLIINENQFKLNCSFFQVGFYNLQIIDRNKVTNFKLIIGE